MRHAFPFAERPFGNPPASIRGTSVPAGDEPDEDNEALKLAVTKARTKLGGVAKRALAYAYDAAGNLKSKTSSVGADIDVSAYAHHASKPHRLASATIGGESHKFVHDADGNIEKYDCVPATCDDRFVEWSGRNLPIRITVGGGKADATPTARDEFAYGPDGARYHRKTTHMDGETLRTEHAYHVGAFEDLLPPPGAAHASIGRTRVTDAVRHVRTTSVATGEDGGKKTTTKRYFEYVHKDHLGSPEATTDAAGKLARTRAHDPFGGRRRADWAAAPTPAEIGELADLPGPPERGHTGHEHLDQAGLIHRGGRIYDPTLGRFLSPDPLVADPASAQAWNGYSYVSNSPMSFVDPSGLSQAPAGCNLGGATCMPQGGGFGLASVVSTHRYLYVDVFVSFVSSWFAPATEPWINYRGVGDGGGWGSYDSHDAFYFGVAYFSADFNATSRVAVAGTPDITGRDMDRGTGRLNHRQIERRVSFETGVDETGAHWYIGRGLICRSSTEGCDGDLAEAVFDHVNRNDVPPFADDFGDGEKILIGNNRVYHREIPKERRTVNTALKGKHILEGTVEHRVYQENGDLYYEVLGKGIPGERRPGLGNFGGHVMFLPGVYRAVRIYGR